jgi:glycosyltransferase involved in cell wall biosynthesis
MKLFIVHPGIQHSYRLANALQKAALFEKIYLFTSILYHLNQKPFLKSFQKRVKPIHPDVIIKNHYLYEFLSKISRKLYNRIIINPNKQVHNNPIYFWQFIFGLLCLPQIWWNRNNLILVTYETAAWPIAYFAKKWNIPTIMDFPSISHEKAKELGINETDFGIAIKKKERLYIDYALFCSDFCRKSFLGFTSSKKDFVLYLGADPSTSCLPDRQALRISGKLNDESSKTVEGSLIYEKMRGFVSAQPDKVFDDVRSGQWKAGRQESAKSKGQKLEEEQKIKISFIANLEYRKGLDILLKALYFYTYKSFLEVHLIGKIRPEWVQQHLPKEQINTNIQLIYQPAMSQKELFGYLNKHQFDLNVQPSRFDSFAMVVPETMMQGIPNIVSPFVGAGEMLKNGVDGFVMEKLNAECLANGIIYYVTLSEVQKQELKLEVLKSAQEMTWENYNLIVKDVFQQIFQEIKYHS